ncbi:MAG: hypothetical protein JW953_19190 [Anaerolineae bacterium]|nr:hypothetical protein [Anaerolineae bacterium]
MWPCHLVRKKKCQTEFVPLLKVKPMGKQWLKRSKVWAMFGFGLQRSQLFLRAFFIFGAIIGLTWGAF